MADGPGPECARINLLWQRQAQFAGYLVAQALRLGAPRGIAIDTSPLDFNRGPVDTVLAGASEFAVASPSHLLESVRADELVMILAVQQDSAMVYPAHRSRGIEELADLAGRRVGVWPGHEDLELRWMLLRAGVDPESVARIPMGDTVTPFMAGEIDCAQMTVYHELHQLHAAGHGEDRLRLFRAADSGAALVKDGLITTRRLVDARPEFVQAVVDTVLEGWARAFADPRLGVECCLQLGRGLDRAGQAQQLADIRALVFPAGGRAAALGYPDPVHLERAVRALRDLGLPVSPLAARQGIDTRFWEAAPRSARPAS